MLRVKFFINVVDRDICQVIDVRRPPLAVCQLIEPMTGLFLTWWLVTLLRGRSSVYTNIKKFTLFSLLKSPIKCTCIIHLLSLLYSVSQPLPRRELKFFHFFTNGWEFLIDFYTYLLHVPIYTRPQIFIQLSPTLTKLCHTKRDYPVHIICSKCPPSAEMHAFRRVRKSLIALLIVVCGKSLWNKQFYNVSKHVGYGMTSPMTSFAE